jgi:hypothetical protein
MRTQSASDETSFLPIDLNEAASRITGRVRVVFASDERHRYQTGKRVIDVPEHGLIPEKVVPFTAVADISQNKNKNGRYVFVTVRALAGKYATDITRKLGLIRTSRSLG